MKKVNKDPFSNGSDHRAFEFYCCGKCIKSSEPRDGGDGLVFYINQREDGMPKCAIQRDIILRMMSNEPISGLLTSAKILCIMARSARI